MHSHAMFQDESISDLYCLFFVPLFWGVNDDPYLHHDKPRDMYIYNHRDRLGSYKNILSTKTQKIFLKVTFKTRLNNNCNKNKLQ